MDEIQKKDSNQSHAFHIAGAILPASVMSLNWVVRITKMLSHSYEIRMNIHSLGVVDSQVTVEGNSELHRLITVLSFYNLNRHAYK